MGLLAQLFGEPARGGDADGRDVGRLALLGILARGLAERRGARIVIEDVVYHLECQADRLRIAVQSDRKSTRLNSSHLGISYAVFCLKKKNHYNDLGVA